MNSTIKKTVLLGHEIAMLGFGTMRLPMANGVIQQEMVDELVSYALEQGVNYFDTAFVYCRGNSEASLGKALSNFERSTYYIADKMTLWEADSVNYLEEKFQNSLKNLQTEYIDFYLMHSLNVFKYEKAKSIGAIEWALQKKAEGKIKYVGFSIHDTVDLLNRVIDEYPWDFAQIQYNYFDTDGEPGAAGYQLLVERKLPIIIMEPLKGGLLAELPDSVSEPFRAFNASNVSFAFRWLAEQPYIHVILSGMNTMTQLKENIDLFKTLTPLTAQEHQAIQTVKTNIRNAKKIPCTGCQYCIPCPANIDIPGSFRAGNLFHLQKKRQWISGLSIDVDLIQTCLNCGQCKEKCPQKIDIPTQLKTLI